MHINLDQSILTKKLLGYMCGTPGCTANVLRLACGPQRCRTCVTKTVHSILIKVQLRSKIIECAHDFRIPQSHVLAHVRQRVQSPGFAPACTCLQIKHVSAGAVGVYTCVLIATALKSGGAITAKNMVTVGDVKQAITAAGYGRVVKCRYLGKLLHCDNARFTTDVHGAFVLATVQLDGDYTPAPNTLCRACEYFAVSNFVIPYAKMQIF